MRKRVEGERKFSHGTYQNKFIFLYWLHMLTISWNIVELDLNRELCGVDMGYWCRWDLGAIKCYKGHENLFHLTTLRGGIEIF